MGKPRVALNDRIDPEQKKIFDVYCTVKQRSQSWIVEGLIRYLNGQLAQGPATRRVGATVPR
jgi:hypothetical protein